MASFHGVLAESVAISYGVVTYIGIECGNDVCYRGKVVNKSQVLGGAFLAF